jgi:hypothetical protein
MTDSASRRPAAIPRTSVVGTFTLIFVGAGSIIATQGTDLTAIGLGARPRDRPDDHARHLHGRHVHRSDAWIYWAGPLLGGALAAVAYHHLYLRTLSPEPPGPPETGLDEPRPGDAASI